MLHYLLYKAIRCEARVGALLCVRVGFTVSHVYALSDIAGICFWSAVFEPAVPPSLCISVMMFGVLSYHAVWVAPCRCR
jgi:hypothetical protein